RIHRVFIAQDGAPDNPGRLVRVPQGASRAAAYNHRVNSAAAVFLVKIRQDIAPHHFDDAQDFRRFHAGPAHPEDQIIRIQTPDALLDLLDDLVRSPQDEAVAGEILERHAEAFL